MKTAMCMQKPSGQAPSFYQLSSELMDAVKQEDYSRAAALREFLGGGLFGHMAKPRSFFLVLFVCVYMYLSLFHCTFANVPRRTHSLTIMNGMST
jgi:hypothetical protein